MAVSCIHLVLLLCLVPATVASPRRNLRMSPSDFAAPSPADESRSRSRPTTFFEVDRPLRPPPGSVGPCSTLLLSASFAFTFTKPPATAAYSPPPCLASKAGGQRASAISLAVLEWRATCQGVQYDRIFGVWLGGAELLRGSTAEPLQNGVVWSVSKDVTRYASLLAAAGNSTLAVFVENLVNSALTGVYYANVTLHLYLRHTPTRPPPPAVAPADLIVPMSRGLPLNDGLWYKIQNATDAVSASVTLPSNTYRAVVEVFVSFHGDDEFWWTNPPGADADGPFREVTVRVDGVLAGAAWPFPVIFTGGINPLLWRPITGIGSFSLPTYDVELTPLLGKMLDGEAHELGFAVTSAVDVWYVDANLHLWLDPGSTATAAGLVSYVAPELAASATSSRTTASRRISAAGWVESSYGNITTNATQTFAFDNTNTGDTVNQTTVAHASVAATGRAGGVGVLYYSAQTRHSFPLFWDSGADQVTVTHGLEETTVAAGLWSSGPRYQSQRNTQRSRVIGGGSSWGIRQTYKYEATDECYSRNVTSSDYSIESDQSSEACVKGPLR